LTNAKKATLCIRGNEYPINDILKKSRTSSLWTWKMSDHEKPVSLYWHDSGGGIITCFASKEKTPSNVLAKFTSPVHLRKHGRPQEMNQLELSPQGHEYFDDILISALILERLRTMPSL